MRRLFIFSALLFGLVSCELQIGDLHRDPQNEIQRYTIDAFSSHVIMPVMMAELALDFDAYLALSDEEKAKDFRFFGNIRKPDENTYLIGLGDMTCTIQTGGKSIWEDGAAWTFLSFTADTHLNGSGTLYCTMTETIVLESAPVVPGDDSMRLLSAMLGKNPVGMVLCSSDEGFHKWNVGSAGDIEDTGGYMAEYMTGADGVYVTKRYNAESEKYEYICDGDFLVTIFKNNEPIDMCKAVFEPGMRVQYK